MFGLIVSDPACDSVQRECLHTLLTALDIPLTGFTDMRAPHFSCDEGRAAFLRKASAALLQPGQPLPISGLLAHLSDDALPGNVIRRYLFLQFSLMPYLRPGQIVTPLDGCFLVGRDLLIVPVSPDDTVDAQLPPGVWTELTGSCWQGRLRQMRGYNEMPVLVRANTLLPIGVNDRSPFHDDADRLTLHWFQPHQEACCTLADRTCYIARLQNGHASVQTNAEKPFHLILHRDGTETLIC